MSDTLLLTLFNAFVLLMLVIDLGIAAEAALGAAAPRAPQNLVVSYAFDTPQTVASDGYTRVALRGCGRSRPADAEQRERQNVWLSGQGQHFVSGDVKS